MLQKIFLFVFTLTLYAPSRADCLPKPIATALRTSGIKPAHVSFIDRTIDRPIDSARFNADNPLNPASVMKIMTSLVALDNFGPAYTVKTSVLFDGTLSKGMLKGNLVIQGGGDPALNLEHFRTLLGEIRARGLRQIEGDILIDNSFFAIAPSDPGEFDGEPLKPYNATPSALLVNYNVLPLYLSAINGTVLALIDPPSLTISNLIRPDNDSTCGNWDDNVSISRSGTQLNLGGYYPTACGDRTLWLSALPNEDTAASLFRAYWSELGGTLTGSIRQGSASDKASVLLEFDSPPLSEIVRLTNKYSNNVMAKMLFLDLGAARYGAPATWDKSRRAIHAWLAEKKLDMPELVIDNGSGLSRTARISAGSVAKLLVWASKQPLYYEFAASLPALGLEGTQRHRMQDSPQAGRAWLKSGSLDGIHNLAGYILDHKGRRKVFVLFINGASGPQAEIVQKAALEWAIGSTQ